MATAKKLGVKELLFRHVPSHEAKWFRDFLETNKVVPRYAGPYGFTGRYIMVRGERVTISDREGEHYTFTVDQARKEA